MKEGQKSIFFLGGETVEALEHSPHLEQLTKDGFDVLFFTDPVDEYFVQHVQKFEDFKLSDISKEGFKQDDDERELLRKYKEEFEPLTTYLKDLYGDAVQAVEVSNRLHSSPCALVSVSWGMSANMERIVTSQPMIDKNSVVYKAKKNLEINPKHPVIKQLLAIVKAEQIKEETENIARVLLDSATIASGFTVKDNAHVSKRLNALVSQSLGLDPLAIPEDEVEIEKPSGGEQGEDKADL